MESVICDYCGSYDSAIFYKIPDLLLQQPTPLYTLVKCRSCGLVYQNPRPQAKELDAFYPSEYESFSNDIARSTSMLSRAASRIGFRKRTGFVTKICSSGTILDVGCANGSFLQALQKYPQYTLMGVEINQFAAEQARKKGLDIRRGNLFDAHLEDNSVDVITMWDVLEHLPSPMKAIAEVHRVLKPGGHAVIKVPNLDSWDAKLFKENWSGLDLPRHFYVFRPLDITRMLRSNGFELARTDTTVGVYPNFLLSVRFWMFNKRKKSVAQNKFIKFLNNPLIRLFTVPLMFLYSRFNRGPGITFIARKIDQDTDIESLP